jgi:predicted transcriptional regulator
MPRTTIVLKDALDLKVREVAKERDRSRNYIISEAIAFYLEQHYPQNGTKPATRKKAGAR